MGSSSLRRGWDAEPRGEGSRAGPRLSLHTSVSPACDSGDGARGCPSREPGRTSWWRCHQDLVLHGREGHGAGPERGRLVPSPASQNPSVPQPVPPPSPPASRGSGDTGPGTQFGGVRLSQFIPADHAGPSQTWPRLPRAHAACPALPCPLSCPREEPAQPSWTGVLDRGDGADPHRNPPPPSAHLCQAEATAQAPPLPRSRQTPRRRFLDRFGPRQRSVCCSPSWWDPRSARAVGGVGVCGWIRGARRLQHRGTLPLSAGASFGHRGDVPWGLRWDLRDGWQRDLGVARGLPWPAPLWQAAPSSPARPGQRGQSSGHRGPSWDLRTEVAAASPAPRAGLGGPGTPRSWVRVVPGGRAGQPARAGAGHATAGGTPRRTPPAPRVWGKLRGFPLVVPHSPPTSPQQPPAARWQG